MQLDVFAQLRCQHVNQYYNDAPQNLQNEQQDKKQYMKGFNRYFLQKHLATPCQAETNKEVACDNLKICGQPRLRQKTLNYGRKNATFTPNDKTKAENNLGRSSTTAWNSNR